MRRSVRSCLIATALIAAAVAVPTAPAHAQQPTVRLYYLADVGLDGSFGLYSSNTDGSSRTTLIPDVADASLENASVSPDGSQIAFLVIDATTTSLWTIDAGGFGPRRVRQWAGQATFQLRWSPDGTKIVFRNGSTGGPSPVQVITLANGAATTVANSTSVFNPVYDPSNPAQLYGNLDLGTLVTMPLSGATQPVAVAGSPAKTSRPQVSPDGSTLAFSNVTVPSNTAPKADLTTLKAGATHVLATGDANVRPALSPDGVTVYFDKVPDQAHGFVGNLWSAPLDGSAAATQITDTPTTDEWSVSAGSVDTTPPSGKVTGLRASLNGAHPVLHWTFPTTDPDAVNAFVCRAAGTTAPATFGACTTVLYRGPATEFTDTVAANGTYSYSVFTADRFGNVASTPATRTMQALNPAAVSVDIPTSTGTTAAPFRVRWGSAGAPAGTPYTVDWATKARFTFALGAYQPWLTGTTLTTGVFGAGAVPTTSVIGQNYYLRAVATDLYGNRTAASTGRATVPLDQTKAGFSRGWSVTKIGGRWLGSITASTTTGASAAVRLTVSGYSVIGDRCTACGQLRIYVDNVLKATVDTHAFSTQLRRVLWTGRFSTIALRTLKVVVVGTKGRPRVNLDGFAAYQ